MIFFLYLSQCCRRSDYERNADQSPGLGKKILKLDGEKVLFVFRQGTGGTSSINVKRRKFLGLAACNEGGSLIMGVKLVSKTRLII